MNANGQQAGVGKLLADRLLIGSLIVMFCAAGVLVFAGTAPVDPEPPGMEAMRRGVPPVPFDTRNIGELHRMMAGRRLIRPTQVQAAVKDTGAAARLAKQLNLQGVIQMGGSLVAYIGVKGQNVKSVKKGGKILSFTVKDIQPGKVVLSLDGVEVELGH